VLKRLFVPVGLIVLVVVAGASGYRFIEGWNWLDSVYMSVITLATIGFGETHPLSPAGRIFTIGLIAVGLAAISYLVTVAGRVMFEEVLGPQFWRRRMQSQIDKLSGHYVLCGCGRVGRLVRREFEAAGHPFVVVEREEAHYRELVESGVLALHADATTDQILIDAGIERAKGVVTALPDDASNLYVVITAHDLNPNIPIVARAETEAVEKRLRRAGATRVISPNAIGGRAMAHALLQPEVLDFLNLATARSDFQMQIEQVLVQDQSAMARDRAQVTLMRDRFRVSVIAMRKAGASSFEMPAGAMPIESGDVMIVVGGREECTAISKHCEG
jgi:voltage-gated potassium channel